ncbi:natural killer cell receptor 2B4 isoform X2 [Peromyscus californicus insignis]|uniref:natural killer cell receptor 2B4 isoform X2 n=1 Tax=Peromyscus californicus insignis TaxID=564181 RepID=UPI0022A71991|nr:natural killer cell receptor 2B4 isoform X2 [Peromyscus californicus insignis]
MESSCGWGCSDSTKNITGISGKLLWLQPSNIQTKNVTVRWMMIQPGSPGKKEILTWKNHEHPNSPKFSNGLNNIYYFNTSDFTLGIKSAKLKDSGLYELEITKSSGAVCTKKFQILILDHVEKPHLQGQWVWEDGMCQLSLYCSVSEDDNVSYALYRGSELISELRNFTYLENETDSSLHTYTCNVSNKVSSASDTLNFSQGCQSVPEKVTFLPFVVIIVILVILFLGAVTCFCLWDKKRKQSQSGPNESSTVYEYVNDPQVRANQVGHSRTSRSPSAVQESERGQREPDRCLFEEQMPEQKPPGDGGTIYSMIQYKPSDSASQDKYTLYSVIQPSKKSGSKKRKQNPPSNCTVYEEVGKQCLKARTPARLSRRELENFDVYS